MAEKNTLANLTAEAKKELIFIGELKIEELSNSELYDLLDLETDLLSQGKGDMDWINGIAALLDKRNGDILSDEEVSSIIQKTKENHITVVSRKAPKRYPSVKRIAMVAAAIMLIFSISVMVATAFGVDIDYYIKQALNLPVGESVSGDNITVENGGKPQMYRTIEGLLEAEKPDIMYPTVFPEGYEFKLAEKAVYSDGIVRISFNTNSPHVHVSVQLNPEIRSIETENVYMHNGITYYIYDGTVNGDPYVQANCYHENNYYTVVATSYEDLILIIDNLKQYKS